MSRAEEGRPDVTGGAANPSEHPAARSGASRRIAGIDVARALAIIGMVTVHISPSGTGSSWAYLLAVPRGRSAILFGLVAGVGVSLLVASRRTSLVEARATLAWRAIILLLLGLALQRLDHNVFVILADYAALFVVAIVIVTWHDRWLLTLAGLSVTLGSVGYLYGRIEQPEVFTRQPAEWGMPVADLLHALVLSGPYPLVTWLAPFAFGMWLGRRDLASPTLRRRLLTVGGGLAIVVPALSFGLAALIGDVDAGLGWWQLLDDAPHTQTPLWLVSATASGVAVLGGSLIVAELQPRVAAPLASAGRLAFTWYVGHLLVLHVDESLLRTGTISGTVTTVAMFALIMVIASTVWSARFSRGPLEYLLQRPRRKHPAWH